MQGDVISPCGLSIFFFRSYWGGAYVNGSIQRQRSIIDRRPLIGLSNSNNAPWSEDLLGDDTWNKNNPHIQTRAAAGAGWCQDHQMTTSYVHMHIWNRGQICCIHWLSSLCASLSAQDARLRLEEPAGPHPASISYTTTSIAGLYRSISILRIKRAASRRAQSLSPSPSNRHQSARKRPQFLCPASSTWLNKSTRRCHACITS